MLSKLAISCDHRCPGARLWIRPEALSSRCALDNRFETVCFGEFVVTPEPVQPVCLPTISSHGPMEQQSANFFRVMNTECQGYRTPHAAAHDIGGIDSQIIQQGLCLPRVTPPPQALDPSTRSARFAPIIENDLMLCCKCIERVNVFPGAGCNPFVNRGSKAARREHQQRRTRTFRFIINFNPIKNGSCHSFPPPSFDSQIKPAASKGIYCRYTGHQRERHGKI